ncbi:M48 family metallopeptidase [Uliginosibacterium gangwonense]|uniref:M48 family metallopeptidase n=1 Tax=Uliginosibacterium gangwonense TaxID=392736 RepID=UPI000382EB12|nr:SprT family zinc-dependent metalloprotease [Uliginosibacterium gangwonense]
MPRSSAGEAERRVIRLGGRELEFTLRRSSRRTLGLTIDSRGLTVTLPLRASLRDAEAFMHERAAWIFEKLDTHATRAPAEPTQVADGSQFPILGQPCRVTLLAGANRAHWVEGFEARELRLLLRRMEDAQAVLLRGLQRYALDYFQGRLEEYAYILDRFAPGLALPPLRLSNARTRWGSCSRHSGIRLNWRLIHLPPAQIDYVVAHEMAHLVEMNHSPRFWAVVAAIMPDYEAPKAALRHAHKIIPTF